MDRLDMYSIQTVSELDAWATRNGLSADTDTELSLRRVTLLAHQLTVSNNRTEQQMSESKCLEYDKVFKRKSDLLRHEITCHGDSQQFSCPHCETVFNRKDNLNNHLFKTHRENTPPNKKRKGDGISESVNAKQSNNLHMTLT